MEPLDIKKEVLDIDVKEEVPYPSIEIDIKQLFEQISTYIHKNQALLTMEFADNRPGSRLVENVTQSLLAKFLTASIRRDDSYQSVQKGGSETDLGYAYVNEKIRQKLPALIEMAIMFNAGAGIDQRSESAIKLMSVLMAAMHLANDIEDSVLKNDAAGMRLLHQELIKSLSGEGIILAAKPEMSLLSKLFRVLNEMMDEFVRDFDGDSSLMELARDWFVDTWRTSFSAKEAQHHVSTDLKRRQQSGEPIFVERFFNRLDSGGCNILFSMLIFIKMGESSRCSRHELAGFIESMTTVSPQPSPPGSPKTAARYLRQRAKVNNAANNYQQVIRNYFKMINAILCMDNSAIGISKDLEEGTLSEVIAGLGTYPSGTKVEFNNLGDYFSGARQILQEGVDSCCREISDTDQFSEFIQQLSVDFKYITQFYFMSLAIRAKQKMVANKQMHIKESKNANSYEV